MAPSLVDISGLRGVPEVHINQALRLVDISSLSEAKVVSIRRCPLIASYQPLSSVPMITVAGVDPMIHGRLETLVIEDAPSVILDGLNCARLRLMNVPHIMGMSVGVDHIILVRCGEPDSIILSEKHDTYDSPVLDLPF